MPELPRGTITLLFTDIEGSTHLLQQFGDQYADVLADCRQLLRSSFQACNGYEVDTQGDAFLVAFARATDAVSAAVAMQRTLAAHTWPDGVIVRVRIGLHTGEPQLTSEGYIGLDVHRAARIMSAGHGGQVLLSQTTKDLVEHDLPNGVGLQDLGMHRLKDLQRPCHLFQLVIVGLPADFPPLKTLDTHPNNLPVQSTLFIGRQQEVAAVQSLLRREDVRLLTLTGTGGAGKTRLGLQVAAELGNCFADGVYFVNLAPISDASLVVSAIAQAFGLKEAINQSLLNFLKVYLRGKQVLLLLDNFEQVVSAAEQVVELLGTCPKLRMIITSRTPLHVRGEQEYFVPPLAVPDSRHLPDLVTVAQNEAVTLFVQRAQAVKPEFQVGNANASAIVEICARLDGLPLAIELAAALIKLFPPHALLTRLTQRLNLLTIGAQDAPMRQQTLRNTIEWSYHLLDASEQRLFQRLSIFVNGCTLEAIEALCAALEGDIAVVPVWHTVASLLDKSLLQQLEQEYNEPRLVMLETIREYGLEMLTMSGEMEATQQAHAAYYLRYAEEAELHLKRAEQTQWLVQLEQEQENLRAVLAFLLERARTSVQAEEISKQAGQALRLGTALVWFWYERGYSREGLAFMEQALLVAGSSVSIPLRAKALNAAADLAFTVEDTKRAEVFCRESLDLSRKLEDKVSIAAALDRLGSVERLRSQFAPARAHLEEANALFQEAGENWKQGRCLTELARIATAQGEYERADTLLEQSLTLYRRLGDTERIAWVLYLLAQVYFLSQNDPQRAQALCEQSLSLMKEAGDNFGIAYPMGLLGEMYLDQGDLVAARQLLEECLAIHREVAEEGADAIELRIALARLTALQGDLVGACHGYQECLALLNESNIYQEFIAASLEGLGTVVAASGVLRMSPLQAGVRPLPFAGNAEKSGTRWAVLFWGAAEVLREDIGCPLPPVYRSQHEQALTIARRALGKKSIALLWAEGRGLPLEQIIHEALRIVF